MKQNIKNNIKIRRATEQDCDGISFVHLKSWQETYIEICDDSDLTSVNLRQEWAEKLDGGNVKYLVAILDNKVVGFISFGEQYFKGIPADSRIYELYILNEFKGRGIGISLWKKAMLILVEDGYSKSSVCVVAENIKAIEFYKHIGGAFHDDNGEPVIIGGKTLRMKWYIWNKI